MSDPMDTLREAVRTGVDALAQDYALRAASETFDADGWFFDLRRSIEARALTLDLVAAQGPMGGGGPDEA
jgi:hypothetical protein